MTRVAPNPFSPFADADPALRHLFPVPVFLPAPEPGGLLPAGCERLAVVPEDVTEVGGELPDGLCPTCVAVMREGQPTLVDRPVRECRECDMQTQHDGLCALCRQQMHDAWWPTRETAGVRP